MKTIKSCLAFFVWIGMFTSVHAATPTAVWEGSDLVDGNEKNGMKLYLNGNTSAKGVVTIGSASVYVETGMTSSSPHAGTEATIVVTWENVSPKTYGAVATFTTASQTNAVGVECFGYSEAENNQLYWIKDNYYSGWNPSIYPNDLALHKVAYACASPTSGTGSGGYNGSAIAIDGEIADSSSSITASGNCITRIDIGGYTDRIKSENYQTGARITRIAVYDSALSTDDLKKATGEDPEPGTIVGAIWGNVGNASTSGVATAINNTVSFSSFEVDFGATDNISQKAIGSEGKVKITKVRLFVDSNATAKPSTITISQGDAEVTSDSCSFVDSQKIYGALWPTTTSHYWTRKAIDATFASETQFDTTKPIAISFDTTQIVGIRPTNSVCVGANYTPAIEIKGDYTKHGEGPEITKDDENHTWVVDTTYGAYEFTSEDVAELSDARWAVTLKSRSENSATINFGTRKGSQPSHFTFESGTHNFIWLGDSESLNFNKSGTAEDPSVFVKSGATLNFTAKDITGWKGAANVKKGNVIRVSNGGTLNLLQSGSSTHYYQGRYYLDPGATINADSYTIQKSLPTFRLNGGAMQGAEQLYVPDSTNASPVATLSAANGLYLHTDDTKGLGIYVGTNSTLNIDAAVSSADANEPIAKWGAGTLAINGALSGYKGALTINAGALKLPQTTIAGSLALAANTVLDIAYDGLPSEGTTLLTATGGIAIDEAAVVKVNGDVCDYEIEGNAIVFGRAVVEVPAKDFTYEPKVNASPTGWMTSFSGEPFTAAGQFRLGPDGECVSVVSSGRHPWSNLSGRSNYTMALYADISQMAYDMTGRYMLEVIAKPRR